MKGWYFSDESKRLSYADVREIAIGVTHEVKGDLKMCEHGLHFSQRLLDALRYAPGPVIWEVKPGGNLIVGDDKCCARSRTYLRGGIDISDVLWAFSRRQALSVAHLWDMPDVVRQYLETGDEGLRTVAACAAVHAITDAADRAAADAAAYATNPAAHAAYATHAALAAANAAVHAITYAATRAAAYAATYAAANDMLTGMVEAKLKEVGQ